MTKIWRKNRFFKSKTFPRLRKQQIVSFSLIIIIFLMLILINPTRSVTAIDELYIFGDSLSDIGNFFKLTEFQKPPSPPYYSGRYSNGRLWVEYLASKLQLSQQQVENSAWGGATTEGKLTSIPSLKEQIKNFVATHQNVEDKALCIIWIGANDYLFGTTNVTETVKNVTDSVLLLSNTGIKKFLIVNLPDLGKLPATRNTDISSSLSALTKTHNTYLSKSLKQLEHQLDSNIKIVNFDVYSLYNEVINHPRKYGLTNVSDPCLKDRSVCQHPEEFLFWDNVHPTEVAHQILGQNAFSLIFKLI